MIEIKQLSGCLSTIIETDEDTNFSLLVNLSTATTLDRSQVSLDHSLHIQQGSINMDSNSSTNSDNRDNLDSSNLPDVGYSSNSSNELLALDLDSNQSSILGSLGDGENIRANDLPVLEISPIPDEAQELRRDSFLCDRMIERQLETSTGEDSNKLADSDQMMPKLGKKPAK